MNRRRSRQGKHDCTWPELIMVWIMLAQSFYALGRVFLSLWADRLIDAFIWVVANKILCTTVDWLLYKPEGDDE